MYNVKKRTIPIRGGDLDLPYTHLLTIGNNGFDTILGYFIGSYGDITPVFVKDNKGAISELIDIINEKRLLIHLDQEVFVSLYLGRSDTGKSISCVYNREELSYSSRYELDTSFFTLSDVGKTIPIWLSDSPPPYA